MSTPEETASQPVPGSFPTVSGTDPLDEETLLTRINQVSTSDERQSLKDTLGSGSESPKRRHFALSPQRLFSTISRAASPIKKIPTPRFPSHKSSSSTSTPLSHSNSVKSYHSDNEKLSIEGISKSFVGFLTAASVYAGFQDIEDENQIGTTEDINEFGEALEDELPASVSTFEGSRSSTPKLEDTKLLETKQSTSKNSGLLTSMKPTRNKSKFELSVVRRMTTNDSDSTGQKRAVALSAKLKKIFDIADDDEFIADYPCWLMGDVLLQGHLYITKLAILFFAFLPKKQGSVIKSGTITIKSYPSMREHRKWAVLKDSTFSIYSSSTDLYFPNLVIDLRIALRAEIIFTSYTASQPHKPVWIRIITESRNHSFLADTLDAARAWVSALKKQIFASRNRGDQVAIKIPLQNILDIELTSVLGGTNNLRIKIIESADSFAVDDYFLMFISKGEIAVQVIKKVIKEAGVEISECTDSDEESGMESDLMKSKLELLKKSSSVVQTSHMLIKDKEKKHKYNFPLKRQPLTSENDESLESLSEEFQSFQKSAQKQQLSNDPDMADIPVSEVDDSTDDGTASKPPVLTSSEDATINVTKSWSTRSLVQGLTSFTHNLISSPSIHHYDEKCALIRGGDDPYFVKSEEQRIEATKRFIKHFSLNDRDKLISTYPCYLVKGIPTYGKIYLGSNEMCFRSTLPGTSTIMILPFTDIENISKEKGFRFGYSGLVVVIHGHEELFFEFSSHEVRDDCELLLLKQIDVFKKASADSTGYPSESSSDESYKLAESSVSLASARLRLFENRITDEIGIDVPIIIEDHPLTKTKVKPIKTFRFTLLTIGSRGDVQPYIALGKGLLKEGHSVKIVTHAEFEPWIKSHGIEFDVIAGDPSELMALMVNNPSINYNFIKEAKSKFRSWIDDLLVTSWKACQDTDVLIESPSSICGIHIAEKLQIPYFRAFTMPWTRTRAYPHAFMVPDQKLGGAYNYMTHVAFENGYWRGTSYQINKWRVETLGLRKTNLAAMKQSSVPFLYNMSPAVFPPSVDFAEWIHVTGYWFLNESNDYKPPKELTDFMQKARDDGKKLVYIGFGSIVVSNPAELTKAVCNAVVEADVRCIMNKGWSDRLGAKSNVEIELPKEVYNAGSVPHDWLFPQLDATVHHGGSGTTGASLRFGLPTIIKPFFGDQKFYAGRVEDLGCGIGLKDLNYKSLAKALKEVTTNARIIEKARSIGTKIRSEHGVQYAIETIYMEMEYARKLSVSKNHAAIKADPTDEEDEMDDSWLLI
ncbi:glycosyltransferase family 1 protein [[Candida] arabinofermentans NRRL YB-2248]|uniref:Sterol 3-beta-glucosyltransferase n=1 Tax=[Candida] arabinofermentans NRRL YB-2248 TaxID=983967 RepID=A0A1E4SZY7_9ASCO|nr:glycosyltransferase family 1 protein [[Candida] arabinofermentans NRRL YB-2248]